MLQEPKISELDTAVNIRAGQVWEIPHGDSTKHPILREIKIQSIDVEQNTMHYYFTDDHGIRPVKVKPLIAFMRLVQSQRCRLIQDV